jgi:hypothetical protein
VAAGARLCCFASLSGHGRRISFSGGTGCERGDLRARRRRALAQRSGVVAAGDELSLREASELEPRRPDIAVTLARKRLERGAADEALEAVEGHEGDFAAEGLAARIELARRGVAPDAFAAFDRGDRRAALNALLGTLEEIASGGSEPGSAAGHLDEVDEIR